MTYNSRNRHTSAAISSDELNGKYGIRIVRGIWNSWCQALILSWLAAIGMTERLWLPLICSECDIDIGFIDIWSTHHSLPESRRKSFSLVYQWSHIRINETYIHASSYRGMISKMILCWTHARRQLSRNEPKYVAKCHSCVVEINIYHSWALNMYFIRQINLHSMWSLWHNQNEFTQKHTIFAASISICKCTDGWLTKPHP